ncbi:MAG: formate dehydrogenase accessory sulfurtransferase FdhD [Nitrospirota bacterium]
MNGARTQKVIKVTGDARAEVEDLVALERRLRVRVNGSERLSLYCTPLMVRELVVGLLVTEGVAEGVCAERMSIVYGEEITVDVAAEGRVSTKGASVTSGCVGGISFEKKHTTRARSDPMRMGAGRLLDVFGRFQHRSDLYNSTGCVHSAALSDGEDILCHAEDIGRHNAVDKVIGYALLEELGFSGRLMLASGRLSSEIVSKCARWGIPLVVSRTAPTALALDIAEESGVTVVGFARGRRFNIYTHPERITFP